MGLVVADDGWRIPDRVWVQMQPLLPEPPSHPLGCHRPRVPDRDAMNAILLVLRTGMQWNALNATGICSCSSAYRRFREWAEAGVFLEFWRQGLLAYDAKHGIEWEWLAMDGAPARRRWGASLPAPIQLTELKKGEAIAPHRGQGRPAGDRAGGREPERLQAGPRHDRVDPDRTAPADSRAAARAVPRQGLRLPRGVRARRRVRLHRPRPQPWRGSQGNQARGRLPRPPLGRRAHPLLAEPLPSHPHPLGETRQHLPRDAPPRLRPHHLARHQLETLSE